MPFGQALLQTGWCALPREGLLCHPRAREQGTARAEPGQVEERLWGNEEQGEEERGKAGEHSCRLFLEHLLGARHCAKSITRAITPAGLSTPSGM